MNLELSAEVVIVGIFIIFMLIFVCVDLFTMKTQHHVDLKGVITVTGVLGTFVGVSYGLWYFEPDNPKASLPDLLKGLKIAFFTSVFGMLSSIILTLVHKKVYRKKNKLHELLSAEFKEVKQLLEALPNQTFLQKEFGEVKQLLSEMPKQIQEGAIEKIIEALSDVVRDFNKNLKEQFGENFKKLNESCEQLLEWQKNHIEVMDKTQQAIDSSRQVIESSAAVLEDIAARYGELQSVIEAIHTQTKQLEDHVSKFDMLVENAQRRLEETSIAFNELTSSLGGFATEIKQDFSDIAASVRHASEETQIIFNSQLQAVQQLHTALTNAFGSMEKSIDQMTKDFAEKIQEDIGKVMSTVKHASEETKSMAERQLQSVQQLQETLSNSIATMEQGMSRITEDFAKNIQNELSEIMSSLKHNSEQTQTLVNSQLQQVENMHAKLGESLNKMETSFVNITKEFSMSYKEFKAGIEDIVKQAMKEQQTKENLND